MEINLDVYLTESSVKIEFDNKKSNIEILKTDNYSVSNNCLYFLLNDTYIVHIGQVIDNTLIENKDFDKIISIKPSNEINLNYLEYLFISEASKNKIVLNSGSSKLDTDISDNQKDLTSEYKDKILFILYNFGYKLFKNEETTKIKEKPQSGKVRHKWTKEISQIKFIAKSKNGEGAAIWQSKDKLVLLSGAKLVEDPQLNKDGSINFSAQFAQKLRADFADKIVNYYTTEDIVFPSPNQLGLFLFYGGQNTWIELKDEKGRSLDELSRID